MYSFIDFIGQKISYFENFIMDFIINSIKDFIKSCLASSINDFTNQAILSLNWNLINSEDFETDFTNFIKLSDLVKKNCPYYLYLNLFFL